MHYMCFTTAIHYFATASNAEKCSHQVPLCICSCILSFCSLLYAHRTSTMLARVILF